MVNEINAVELTGDVSEMINLVGDVQPGTQPPEVVGAKWGIITGDIEDQTDLKDILDEKAGVGDSYTKSESDAKYLTEHQSLSAYRTSADQDVIDSGKVDKVSGKGLSTEDYTSAEKTKLSGIEAGAEVNDITDVKVNGTSVVSGGVADIPKASGLDYGIRYGVVSCTNWGAFTGIRINNGNIQLAPIDNSCLTTIRDRNIAITNGWLDRAVKSAMCDPIGTLPNTTNPLNIAWTDSEKTGAWQRLSNIKTTMDSVAVAGAEYFLGEQTTVSFTLPSDALTGQTVSVVFYSGATATSLSVSGTVIGEVPTPSANQRVELNCLWDGTNWAVLNNVMAVV